MKKVASILAAAMLSLTCATAVNAEDFYGSATQGGTTLAGDSAITTASGATVNVTVTDTAETKSIRSDFKASGSLEAYFESVGASAVVDELAKEAGNVADLSCMDIVDISIGDVTLAAGDSVNIPVKVQGIKKGDAVYAIHFGDNGPELIAASATADDTVTLTMNSFSPVMILKDQSPAAGSSTTTTASGETATPATGVYSNVALWAGVLVVAVAAAGIVLYDRKKKAN